MNLEALRASLKEKIAAMRALIDGAAADNRTDLNADEQTTYDGLKAEVDGLKASIARLEELTGLEAGLTQVKPAAARHQGSGPVAHAPGDPAKTDFESFGQFMHAVRFNPDDQRLDFNPEAGSNAADLMAEQRMDTGSAGGFMVPTQFRSEIMRVDPLANIVRSRANVIPAGSPPDSAVVLPALDQSGDAPGNVFGGVEVQWIAEGEDKPETDAKLKEIKLEPHEVAGHIVVTDKLLRNWQAAGPFLENLLRGAVGQAEDYAFLRGDGVGKPLGVLNAGATLAINRGTANTVKYADLVAMEAQMLMRGGSPIWVASQGVLPQLRTMVDGDNRLIYVGPSDGKPSSLMGYPILFTNRQPGLGSKGDIQLLDLSNYLIKDGSGPFVATSEHVHFKQNKTVIKIFWNVDGQPWLTSPFTEENGYAVSPFIALDEPA